MPLTVMTWNVNSIRARLDHVLTVLADHEPDVVCLQETKVDDQLFPRVPFLEFGYTVNVFGSKSQAGVATLTKAKPDAVHRSFREGEKDRHARVLEVSVSGVSIYNLYVPNGTEVDSDAYEYKLRWLARLRTQLDTVHEPTDNVVVVGDFNVAPEARDVWDPPYFEGRLQCTQKEKDALANLVAFGLHDCLRERDDSGGLFTWFDYRTGGFTRNEGMRIDHVYASAPMLKRCTSVVHDAEPRGWDTPSDHLPVRATFADA
ncbi:MAG: exodeoxyribonuclease III [Myxococcota bacterium]